MILDDFEIYPSLENGLNINLIDYTSWQSNSNHPKKNYEAAQKRVAYCHKSQFVWMIMGICEYDA